MKGYYEFACYRSAKAYYDDVRKNVFRKTCEVRKSNCCMATTLVVSSVAVRVRLEDSALCFDITCMTLEKNWKSVIYSESTG